MPAKVTVVPSTHEVYSCDDGFERVVRTTYSSNAWSFSGVIASTTSIDANGEHYYPDKDPEPGPNNHYCLKKETIDKAKGTD